MEPGSRDHTGLVDNHQVEFVKAVVDFVIKRGVHGDIKRTVQSIGLDVGQKDFVVALSQQGHRGSDKDRHFIFDGVMDGSY